MNSITVHTLEIPVRLGCSAEERAFPQKVLFEIEMFFDFSKCIESDEISDTVDYFPIVRALQQNCGDRQWKMIEKLAWDAAQLVLAQSDKIEQVRITATKNILAGSKGFSASVTCRREDGNSSVRSS